MSFQPCGPQIARVRVLHAIPAAFPGYPVNIFVDNVLVLEDISYGTLTDFIDVPAGCREFKAIPVGIVGVSLILNARLKKRRFYTLVVLGSLENSAEFPLHLNLYKNKFCPGRASLIHVAAGTPCVDFYLNASSFCPTFINVSYQCQTRQAKFCQVGTVPIKANLAGTQITIAGPTDILFNRCLNYLFVLIGNEALGLNLVLLNGQNNDALQSNTLQSDTPQADTPQADAPQDNAPQDNAPQADAPQADAPQADAPQVDAPQADAPQVDAPQADAPQVDAPQADAPQVDAPQVDAPQADAPQADAPQADAPQADAPQNNAPQDNAPQVDAPQADAPQVNV